jgi:hypothetical protein
VGVISGGTKRNVIAAEAELIIDTRVLTAPDGQRITEAIYALKPHLDGVQLEISGGLTRPPFEFTPANQELFETAKTAAAELGRQLKGIRVGGGSDGNFTSTWGIPTLDGLGPVGDGAHAVTEHMLIEESLEHYLQDTSFPTSGKSGSYESAEDYINSLNEDTEWVSYDNATGEVTISSIEEFSLHCKKATKPVAAFDKLDKGGHELFNTGDGETTHFDSVLYEIIKGSAYEEDFAVDLASTDALGNSIEYRLNMFSPLYYLMEANEGYQTANVASSWRIRPGYCRV